MSPNVRAIALGGLKVADSIVGPLVSVFPASLKYGRQYTKKQSSLNKYVFDPRSAFADQTESLSNALENARRTTFWSKLLPASSTDPHVALSMLPILDRRVLSERYQEMTSVKQSNLELMSTSGSGGEPVNFFLSRSRRSVEWAYVTHAWRQTGYSTSDWRVVFRGFPPLNDIGVGVQFALREVRVTAMRTSEETYTAVAKEMVDKNIRFIHGYPSAISLFASWLAEKDPILARSVQGVFPVSEKLDPERFTNIQTAFPLARVVAFYGLSEKSAFAVCEDPLRGIYSFSPTYGLVEILDAAGNRVKPGQVGRVVTTRLEYPGSSLLRYDTGDVARLLSDQDSSTGDLLRVSDISPRRSVSYVLSRNGEEVATSPGLQAGSELFQGKIAEYQILQKRPGNVEFIYRTIKPLSEDFNEVLTSELQEKLGSAFFVSAREVADIPYGRNGKKPLVVRDFSAT